MWKFKGFKKRMAKVFGLKQKEIIEVPKTETDIFNLNAAEQKRIKRMARNLSQLKQ